MVSVTVFGPPVGPDHAAFVSSSSATATATTTTTAAAAAAAAASSGKVMLEVSATATYGGDDDDASTSTSGDDRHDASSGSSSDGGMSDVPSPLPNPQRKRRRLLDGRSRTPPRLVAAAAHVSSAAFARDFFDRPEISVGAYGTFDTHLQILDDGDNDDWRQVLSYFCVNGPDGAGGISGGDSRAVASGMKRSSSGLEFSMIAW